MKPLISMYMHAVSWGEKNQEVLDNVGPHMVTSALLLEVLDKLERIESMVAKNGR